MEHFLEGFTPDLIKKMKIVTNIQTIFAFSFSDGENQIAYDLIEKMKYHRQSPNKMDFLSYSSRRPATVAYKKRLLC